MRKLQQNQTSLLVALGLSIIAAAGFVLAGSSPVEGDGRLELTTAAQQVIRDTIREEFRTAFGSAEETQIDEVEGGKYLVAGWVDLIAEDGQSERQHFSCTLSHDDQGGWFAENVAVIPQ